MKHLKHLMYNNYLKLYKIKTFIRINGNFYFSLEPTSLTVSTYMEDIFKLCKVVNKSQSSFNILQNDGIQIRITP